MGVDGARTLAHVRSAGQDQNAAVEEHTGHGLRRGSRGRTLHAERDAAAAMFRQGSVPADVIRCRLENLKPVAIARRRIGDELLLVFRKIPAANLHWINAQASSGFGELRFDSPGTLRSAEPAECGARRSMRQNRARPDLHMRTDIRAAGNERAFADHPRRNRGIGANQVVGRNLLKGEVAFGVEAGAHRGSSRGTPHILECLFKG